MRKFGGWFRHREKKVDSGIFKLLRYFTTVSIVVFTVVAALLAVFYSQAARNNIIHLGEQNNVALTYSFANSLWPEFAAFVTSSGGLSADQLRADPRISQLHELVIAQMSGLTIRKVKVYNLQGLTVFSTETSQIGQDKSTNAGFLAARDGGVANELSHKDTFSAFEGEIENRDLLSSYVPIRRGPAQPVEAVFEVYDDVTVLFQEVQRNQVRIVAIVVLILASLYLTLFFVVRHADKLIRRQHERIQQANHELAVAHDQALMLNDQLEQRVTERTADLTQEIEERKKAEHALGQTVKELQAFAYTAAHDLRAPMVTIQGFAGTLRTDMEKNRPERVEEDIRLIEIGIAKMQRLLKAVLEYGRTNRIPQPTEEVSFKEIIQESLEQVAGQVQSQGAAISVAEDFPSVLADRVSMVQVLNNLIVNALDYRDKTKQPTIEIGHRESDGETVYFVRDNGIGISPDQVGKVFELFYRGASESHGTGLGLTIVKRIIEGHGGRVWIESEPGKGTTVCFTLAAGQGQKE